MKIFVSDISHQDFPVTDRVMGSTIRHTILGYIQREHPDFSEDSVMSISELNYYRAKYISDYLAREVGELSELEHTVLSALKEETTLTDKVDGDAVSQDTFGQRIADKVASFGGSWTFIIFFGVFLLIWISVNAFWLANKGFDPFPFILLNLFLSAIAAIQAPVIMMSQNRLEDKDRERGKKDYMINLKSELEIRMVHEKLDHLIMHQQQELMEILKEQMSMMEDILKQLKAEKK